MIRTPEIEINSPLSKTIVELESLRKRPLEISTAEGVFLQLKNLLHIVEAVASARIEGNHTTIASYIEKRDDNYRKNDEQIIEISNLSNALDFIDKYIMDEPISADFIKELHRIVVNGLTHEGDNRAGVWRNEPRYIANADHQPPEPFDVPDLMRELLDYINMNDDEHLDLLKIAIANHRFVWIHPFGNGNGRTDRLFTYALLCKKGYIIPNKMRLFNPTAVFASDRNKYYDMLALADDYEDKHIIAWCDYFLNGVLAEVEKSEKIADGKFVANELVVPAVDAIFHAGFLSGTDASILRRAAKLGAIKAADIEDVWKDGTSRTTIAKHVNRLKDKGLLRAVREGGREYEICFDDSQLTRIVLEQMDKVGLLPIRVDE
ncbi:Fic family protein [Candidatus Saccharibacteria bacterium]|nr:Fic family protein [Candidatus Saccharibacteria bacterium]